MDLTQNRLNAYRIMWIMVLYDLPTETKTQRKIVAKFRKEIIREGFTMFQFSSYIRHCPSRENSEVHIKRVEKITPEKGKICIMQFTDKQFGMMKLIYGKEEQPSPKVSQQLEMF